MYTVHGHSGEILMQSESGCRYRPEIEMDLLSAGYIIRLDGKRLTKKEVAQRAEHYRN